jgi:DNA-binding ferritin-like protein
MAALGAFRHANAMPELGVVKLGWEPHGGQWCAVLEVSNEIGADGLVQLFVERVKSVGERPEFAWSKAVKSSSTEELRREAQHALEAMSADNHQLADWFQAFGSELAHKEGVLESTPFDMTVARQLFLADAEWLTKSLAEPDKKRGDDVNAGSFREALFGPWKYGDNQHSLGWDPATKLMGAFTPKAPTSMNKAGVRAAVWLAMESLPFFPCFFESGLATCGFVKKGRKQSFHWAVWESPLSLTAVRTMLAQAPGIEEDERAGRGLCAMYTSAIYKPNKYLTSFQPAVLKA